MTYKTDLGGDFMGHFLTQRGKEIRLKIGRDI
jgi:hypothetical protein